VPTGPPTSVTCESRAFPAVSRTGDPCPARGLTLHNGARTRIPGPWGGMPRLPDVCQLARCGMSGGCDGPAHCLQSASMFVMTTLYIRDVSDEVAKALKERAAQAGMSLSAYVSGELAKIAARPTNAEIVARLKSRDRSNGPSSAEIVEAVQASRR
jgi:hypothetical protein